MGRKKGIPNKKKRQYNKCGKKNAKQDLAQAIQEHVNTVVEHRLAEEVIKLRKLTAQVGKVALENKKAIASLQDI